MPADSRPPRASVRLERRGDVGVIVIDHPPVNALSAAVRAGLRACLREFLAAPLLKAAVIRGIPRAFSAGADIAEFGDAPREPALGALLREIEDSPRPVVAAIEGVALGGGLELALACHGRVASPDARLGLPEIKLGLLPGAGGTQRLPRLVGLEAAADTILSGDSLAAPRALMLGLVDEVATHDIEAAAADLAARLARSGPPPRTLARPLRADAAEIEAIAMAARKRARGAHAPGRIAHALAAAVRLPPEAGLERERALFAESLADPQSAALRHLFRAERAAGRTAGEARAISRAAVIGAGTMGTGIAIAFADAGLPVCVVEQDPAALERARERVAAHYAGAQRKGKLAAAESDARLARLQLTSSWTDMSDADIAIEAVFENLATKREVFCRLGNLLRDDALLATNTSYLDVDAIGAAVPNPARVLGLHFFSPANVMRLVEIVRGGDTSADTLATAVALARRLGKLPVICGNAPGFVGNRMLQAYGRESQLLMLEGASPAQIDEALERFGMAMGPNAVLDLAGLDIGYRARRERTDLPADPRYFRVADALVEAGRLGQKTGRGSYLYSREDRRRTSDPEVDALIAGEAARLGVERRAVPDDEIIERCILALVNEGARLLGEGVAASAADIDVVWTSGYGFPRWRGGPMHYAESIGLPAVLARVRALGSRLGSAYWSPAPLLERCARDGQIFAAARS